MPCRPLSLVMLHRTAAQVTPAAYAGFRQIALNAALGIAEGKIKSIDDDDFDEAQEEEKHDYRR